MRINDAIIQAAFERGDIAALKAHAIMLVDERNGLEELLEMATANQPKDPNRRVTVGKCVKCHCTHLHIGCPTRAPQFVLDLVKQIHEVSQVEF